MVSDEPSSIQTRPSLLGRLKEGDDTEAWREFYATYGKLVRDFGRRAGLNDAEADDILQETAIGIARSLPGFSYDPKVCRFKTWLLNQTSWRIQKQLKRRMRLGQAGGANQSGLSARPDRTATVERVADDRGLDLNALFELEWRTSLTARAMTNLKARFSLKQIQIFDLVVVKEWSGAAVARALKVSLASVYVTKHRVAAALKREVRRLEKAADDTRARVCRSPIASSSRG